MAEKNAGDSSLTLVLSETIVHTRWHYWSLKKIWLVTFWHLRLFARQYMACYECKIGKVNKCFVIKYI